MRVFSFQSKEVVEQILTNDIYEADPSKSNPLTEYTQDIINLNGKSPIWCFGGYEREDFLNGDLLNTFKCELPAHTLAGKIMLEIEVDDEELVEGVTRNSGENIYVFSRITKDMLYAVYFVTCTRHYYYFDLTVALKLNEDMYFPEGLQTKYLTADEEGLVEAATVNVQRFGKIQTGRTSLLNGLPHGAVMINNTYHEVDSLTIFKDSITLTPPSHLTDSVYSEQRDLTDFIKNTRANLNSGGK